MVSANKKNPPAIPTRCRPSHLAAGSPPSTCHPRGALPPLPAGLPLPPLSAPLFRPDLGGREGGSRHLWWLLSPAPPSAAIARGEHRLHCRAASLLWPDLGGEGGEGSAASAAVGRGRRLHRRRRAAPLFRPNLGGREGRGGKSPPLSPSALLVGSRREGRGAVSSVCHRRQSAPLLRPDLEGRKGGGGRGPDLREESGVGQRSGGCWRTELPWVQGPILRGNLHFFAYRCLKRSACENSPLFL